MRRTILFCSAILSVFFFLSATSRAQKLTYWHPTGGPTGGEISDVGVDSTGNVWVATNKAGCYLSKDFAQTWSPVNEKLPSIGLGFIAISNTGYVYANTQGGKQFFRLNTNPPRDQWAWEERYPDVVRANNHNFLCTTPEGWVFVNGSTNVRFDTTIIGTDTNIVTNAGNGVLRSTDNGTTWSDFTGPLNDSLVATFTRGTAGEYVAITNDGKKSRAHNVYRTTDNGQTWGKLPNPVLEYLIQEVVVAANGNIVVSTKAKSTYRSTDSALYGGRIYVSSDEGNTWIKTYERPYTAYDFRNDIDKMVFVRQSGTIYIDAHGPVLRSTDNGMTWIPGDTVIYGDERASLACPGGEEYVYQICEPGGFFRSADHGKSFVDKNGTIQASFLYGMALNSTGSMFVVSEDFFYHSNDNAATWPQPYIFFGESNFPGVFVAKNDHVFVNSDLGLYRSKDNGLTLEHIISSSFAKYQLCQETTHRLFTWAKFQNSNLLLYSTNDGDKWDTLTNLPGSDQPAGMIAHNDTVVVAGLGASFYRSTDEGGTWTTMTGTAPINQPYKMTWADDGSVLALISSTPGTPNPSSGAWRSSDGGATWSHIFPPQDLQFGIPTDYFGLDADNEGGAFVGSDSGLFRSDKTYTLWTNVSSGLNWGHWDSSLYTNISQVVKNKATGKYYAASRAQSVFESVFELNDVRQPTVTAGGVSTVSNYPNPFSTSTTIRFSIAADALVRTDIYDIMGRRVGGSPALLLSAGTHEIPFDARTLPNGDYMVVCHSDTANQTGWISVRK